MGIPHDVKNIQEELTWISLEDRQSKREKGIFNVLVPLGCAATTGILGTGLYNFCKKNSSKQQLLMRYRVLAQGVTVVLATASIFLLKPSA